MDISEQKAWEFSADSNVKVHRYLFKMRKMNVIILYLCEKLSSWMIKEKLWRISLAC